MFSVWSEVFFTWVFNSAGMVCSLNSCSAFRIDPKARCQLPVLDLPDLPVSRVLLCLLLPSVPIPAAVLGSLLLLSGVSGCVVGAPQKWRLEPVLRKRSHCSERPRTTAREQPLLTTAKKKPERQRRRSTAKNTEVDYHSLLQGSS